MSTRRVRFHVLEIIELPVILGDNPSCKSFPPVQPDWVAQSRTIVDVDLYELTRRKRRRCHELVLSTADRFKMLGGVTKVSQTWQTQDKTRTCSLQESEELIAEIDAKVEWLSKKLTVLTHDMLKAHDALKVPRESSPSPVRKVMSARCA